MDLSGLSLSLPALDECLIWSVICRRGVALESTLCVLCQDKTESCEQLYMACDGSARVGSML